MPDYVSQEVVHLVENHSSIAKESATELLDKNGNIVSKKMQDLVISKLHINGSMVASGTPPERMIQESSVLLKQENPGREVSHILDREFDDAEIFETIDALGDSFTIRLKLNRLSTETRTIYTPKGKVSKKIGYVKLIDKAFENKTTYVLEKLVIKGKTYRNVEVKIE